MHDDCRRANTFAVSVCRQGHATLHLGRSAIFLDVAELRSLIEASRQALAEYEKHAEPERRSGSLERFWSEITH